MENANSAAAAFQLAAKEGDWERVKQMMRMGEVDADQQDESGVTALHLAAVNGHAEVVKTLVSGEVDVDVRERHLGGSALTLSAVFGYTDVAKTLIGAGADVDLRRDNSGDSALYTASANGHVEFVELLACSSANVDLQRNDGRSPLHAASANGQLEMVELLVSANSHLDASEEDGWSPLQFASQNGHAAVVEALIKAGADVNKRDADGSSPLHVASQNGHSAVVKTLVSESADVDARSRSFGDSALTMACQNDHVAVVNLLVSANADVNLQRNSGASPLYMASFYGHSKVASALIGANADVNLQTNIGWSPLMAAAYTGQTAVMQVLIDADADVNLGANDSWTPLFAAALCSHVSAVKILLANGADPKLKPQLPPATPLQVACFNGCFELVKVILQHYSEHREGVVQSLSPSCASAAADCMSRLPECPNGAEMPEKTRRKISDNLLSTELHEKFKKAGFHCKMSSLQSAVADVVQKIERTRWNKDEIFVVGSYSEGWGNSLTCLMGKTDIDSDIDVTQFIAGRLYHLSGRCKCTNVNVAEIVNYSNGHVMVSGLASSPAKQHGGSPVRPAFDLVNAYQCCCYPHIEVIHAASDRLTHLPQSLIESLTQRMRDSRCHLVAAAPPGQAGQQLRVSTTFLEKQFLRSLNEVQGQLFVLLKYLVKKVISKKVKGLKTYHAKCLVFYMVDETPAEVWKGSNLVTLTRVALDKLLQNLRASGADSSECMRHFFIRDAIVYLKSGHSSKEDIVLAVIDTIENLTYHILHFKNQLKPFDSQVSTFYFHPFLNIPHMNIHSSEHSQTKRYHKIYDSVRAAVLQLAQEYCNQQSVTESVNRIPDCAKTARETLRAVVFLKFNKSEEALRVLHNVKGHTVSRGIPIDMTADRATEEMVWQHLNGTDSAWKFCFQMSQCPKFAFLPKFIRHTFPTLINNYKGHVFLNFDAMRKCLMLELIGNLVYNEAETWFTEVVQSEDADEQELMMTLHFCRDMDLLVHLIHLHNREIINYDLTRFEVMLLMMLKPQLVETSSLVTLNELKQRLGIGASESAAAQQDTRASTKCTMS